MKIAALSEEEAGQIGKGFHKTLLSFLYTERLCDFVFFKFRLTYEPSLAIFLSIT
jgi:hypothetical protein